MYIALYFCCCYFSCCCCYCVMLLLFISNYACTIRDKKQQWQYEIVTTMTTTQSNLHKLLSVQELILWGDTMQFYMGKNTDIPPTNWPHISSALLHLASTCRCTQVRCNPHVTPHVQCLTTPAKYMPMYPSQMYPPDTTPSRVPNVPRSDVPPNWA